MDDQVLPRGIASAPEEPVVVHFDGACEPARGGGVATFGYTIEGGGWDLEDSGLAVRPYSEHATNNVAEYVAAIQALERLHGLGWQGSLEARGDSQLVVQQMRGEYAVRAPHLKEYHARLTQLAGTFAAVRWVWIPREQNTRADALSKLALAEHAVGAERLRPSGPVPTPEEDPPPG
ncbi:MAG: ribonuclease HI family protein [Thermoplasmata archaeon]|nr:ribonuclease HI family protein [Thermoplasmata archaeon]